MNKLFLSLAVVVALGTVACDRREEAREEVAEQQQDLAETQREAQKDVNEAQQEAGEDINEAKGELAEAQKDLREVEQEAGTVAPTNMGEGWTKERCEALKVGGVTAAEQADFDRCVASRMVTK